MKTPEISIKNCPHCGETRRRRAERVGNWKALPFARSYSCDSCHAQYIVLFSLVSVLRTKGFIPFYIPPSRMESALYSE